MLLITDPVMKSMGRADEVAKLLDSKGISNVIFSDVEPDPPIELIERAGKIYTDNGCDGIVGLGRWKPDGHHQGGRSQGHPRRGDEGIRKHRRRKREDQTGPPADHLHTDNLGDR